MANIVLAGFDRKAGMEFERRLAHFGYSVHCETFESRSSKCYEADLVFVCGDDVRWPRYLGYARAAFFRKPVVIVSRMADDSHWLQALDAGATDYCSLSIADEHLRWIVDNATKRETFSTAAA